MVVFIGESKSIKVEVHTIHNYDKLFDLFGKDRATVANVERAKHKVWWWKKEGIDLNDYYDVMSEPDIH